MCRHPTRGFTLIELLVVIAVIALLVAILMPSLNQAKDLAIRAKCAAEIRSVALGIHMYGEDNDRWMPYGSASGSGPKFATTGGVYGKGTPNRLALLWVKDITRSWDSYVARTWGLDMYADYVPDFKSFYCPGKQYDSGEYGNGWDFQTWPPGYTFSNLAGYSYCIPGSVSAQPQGDNPPWRYRIDDYRSPWRQHQGPPADRMWMIMADNLGMKYNAWVACNREPSQKDDPHRGKGNNFAFRDGSVRFLDTNNAGDTMYDFYPLNSSGMAWFYANLEYDGLPVPPSWK